MMTTKRLQVTPTANYLARLWILAHDVIVVDLMFGNLITRSRRCPMPINGHPNVLLFH
jgi:hypothetical protein